MFVVSLSTSLSRCSDRDREGEGGKAQTVAATWYQSQGNQTENQELMIDEMTTKK